MIEIEGLVKRYGERTVVRGVNLEIREGEVFGLLGPNGAGKSTTISILAGLIASDGGRVTVGGFDLAGEPERIKPLIGLVPQEIALYLSLSARDNLAFFGRIYGLSGATLKERIAWALDLVKLGDRAVDPVKTFSGGMMRRLNIAVGLIHRPRVLFMDEPTVGVDPQSRNFIFEHVAQLKEGGMTILYTTHYMEEAERLCDRVAIMDAGQILALDTPHGLVNLLGGGVIHAGVVREGAEALLSTVRALPHIRAASATDGRLLMETTDAGQAVVEFIGLCRERGVSILSLEVLQPNLEGVFLHLTGKRLRE
ncbi:MAG: export ABC transporter ATP-binding protein [Syntrophus sp. (in: bacteria)]|nr:export ABC transporter ATP-binding protein [Syntrophus sp. (in: bacteria)]